MPRISVAGNLESRDGTIDKGALITNGYAEPIGEGMKVYSRAGLDLVTDAGSGLGQGITSFITQDKTEILYAIQNGVLSYANVQPVTGTWTAGSAADVGVQGAMCSFGGLLFEVSGTTSYYKSAFTTSAWTTAATGLFGGTSKSGGALVVLSQKMLLIGPQSPAGGGDTSQVWESADGVNWTQIAASGGFTNAMRAQVLVLDGVLYHLGTNDTVGGVDNSVYKSVDGGVNWTLVNATPAYAATARSRFGSCVHGGKMWVMGGIISAAAQDDVWYSTDGNTWTEATGAAAFGARADPSVTSLGPVMCIAGGFGLTSVYTSADGITWTVVSGAATTGSWSNPSRAMAFTHNGRMGIYGYASTASYQYPSGTTTESVSLSSVSVAIDDFADFSQNYDGTEIMVRLSNGAYKINTATQAVTAVTDAQYPEITVRGNPYLNGFFYVMEPDGTIWNSAEDDCTSWAGTDFISAEFEPDGGVALCKYGSYIVAFGRYTTEGFFDAGNSTGSPLSPVQSLTFSVGCAHGNSVAAVESTIIWMGQRKGPGTTFQKGRFVAMLEGQSYKIISTPDVERVLDQDDLSEIKSCVMSGSGHTFYILLLVSSGITLVYDLVTKLWYTWTRNAAATPVTLTSLTQSNGLATATKSGHGFADGDQTTIAGADQAGYNLTVNVTRVSSSVFTYPVSSATVSPATGTITATQSTESFFDMVASCNYQNQQVFQERSGGGIYAMNEDFADDDGQPINYKARGGNWDGGANVNKFISRLQLIGDTVSSTALIRYSDDDYQTYSLYRRVDLSQPRKKLSRLGRTHRRAFEIRHTLSARVQASDLELDLEGGT